MSNAGKKIIDWSDENHSNIDNSIILDESQLVELKVSTGESKIVVIWDGYGEQVLTHSIKQGHSSYKKTVLCRGNICPLCAVGEKVYKRLLIPVYSVDSGDMEVLQFLKFDEYKSLYSQIKNFVKQGEFPLTLEIYRQDVFAYNVRNIETPADKLERIKKQAEAFLSSIEKGDTNISGILQVVDNALVNDPNMRRKLEFKGLDYRKFLVDEHPSPLEEMINEEFVM